MMYSNSKGVKFFLHCKNTVIGRNKIATKTYFFRKEQKEDYCHALPKGWIVRETHSGLPVVKKS